MIKDGARPPSDPGVSCRILLLHMLRRDFHRGVAYLGIATGDVGAVSETFRPAPGLGYLSYGLLPPMWCVAVGWKLYRLG